MAYSSLDNCEENGWLHSDDKIVVGVSYQVNYLGSVEIDYVPSNPAENNRLAIETIRFLTKEKPEGQKLVLTIAAGRMMLASADNTHVVMRHSTSRIAYSTVDTANKRLFGYVALSRRSPTPLIHVFITQSPRMSFELTFTCAQAFDHNYKNWQKNAKSAHLKAAASESGDIDPSNARKSPLMPRKQIGGGENVPPKHSPLCLASVAAALDSSAAAAAAKPAAAPGPSRLHPGDRIADARQGEPVPPSMLDVEDDARMQEDEDAFFTSLAQARSMPNMLDIGVEPEDFNESIRSDTSA